MKNIKDIDFKGYFKFPLKDDRWVLKVLVGGALSLIPIINFFALGYLFEIYKNGIERKEKVLPEWKNWKKMFLGGLVGTAILFVYPMGMLLSLSFLGAVLTLADLTFIVMILAVTGLVGLMGFLFLSPVMLGCYLKENNIKDALNLKYIFKIIKPVINEYLFVLMISFFIFVSAGVCFNMMPFIGPILWVFVNFYVGIVILALFGDVYPNPEKDRAVIESTVDTAENKQEEINENSETQEK